MQRRALPAFICQANISRSLLASLVVRSTSTKNALFGWFTFSHPGGPTYLPPLSGYYSSLPYFQPKHSLGMTSFCCEWHGFPILHLPRQHPIPTSESTTLWVPQEDDVTLFLPHRLVGSPL